MIKNTDNILAFEENMVSLRDFEEKEDLLVENNLEMYSFIKTAQENRVGFTFYLHQENEKSFEKWLKFSSYTFIDKKDTIEIEINKSFYKGFESPYVWGIFYLNNIKIVFLSKVLRVYSTAGDVLSMAISHPEKMIRYQRRESYRVKIPPFSKMSIDLDTNPENEYLQGLKIINISVGGAALLINTNKNIEDIPKEFNNVVLNLEESSFSNIKVKVKRISSFNKGAIPLNIAAQKEQLGWYEMAISFEKLPLKTQQELFFLVNSLSKKVANN